MLEILKSSIFKVFCRVTNFGEALDFNNKICTCEDSTNLVCQQNEVGL